MANYSYYNGWSREKIRDLQNRLNALTGAGLNADGIMGPKTQAAIIAFQRSNGLSQDGKVGNNTWNAIYQAEAKGNSGASAASSKPAALETPEYGKSQELLDAEAALAELENNKPGEYSFKYADQLDALYDQLLNRKDFVYDMNADPLYQQYKDQYTTLGNLAMRDTMGNAAALTGGYGSSYASTAGNQAYQSYLTQLNDKMPELYNMAYTQYRNDGTDLANRLGLLQNADNTSYGRYRDTVGDYYNDLNYNYSKTHNMSQDEWNQFISKWNMAFQQNQDLWSRFDSDRNYDIAQQQAAANAALARAQEEQIRQAMAASKKKVGSSSSSRSSSSSKVTSPKDILSKDLEKYEIAMALGNVSERDMAAAIRSFGEKRRLSKSQIRSAMKGYGITNEIITDFLDNNAFA